MKEAKEMSPDCTMHDVTTEKGAYDESYWSV